MKTLFAQLIFLFCASLLHSASIRVYLGTLTSGSSRGIYLAQLDLDSGELSAPVLAADTTNPSWLSFGPGHHRLYTADNQSGAVSAFAVEPSGRLRLLNTETVGGSSTTIPALEADATGRMLVIADYDGGAVHTLPLLSDGSLGKGGITLRTQGPVGPILPRQAHPRSHSVNISPDNRFALVCDLGLDRVLVFHLDPARGSLAPDKPAFVSVPPGAGARHGAFSPDSRFFYSVTEMGNLICVFRYMGATGSLHLSQTVSSLPTGAAGENYAAEIQIHPNGRTLYVCNRGKGSDNLAVFRRDPLSGGLSAVQYIPCGGGYPRSFALTADSRWLLCANQFGNNVVVFRVEPESGRLAATGHEVALDHAMCVLYAP